MFQGKLHDEEDDELPRYEEEESEEGAEQPREGTIEIEDVVIEEDDETPVIPSPRKPAAAAETKRPKKAATKKKTKAKSKSKSRPKKASKKGGKRRKR
jgi:hypothetical protein